MPTAINRPTWFTGLLILLLGAQLTLLVEALRAPGGQSRGLALNAVAGVAIVGGLLAGSTHKRLGWALVSIAAASLLTSFLMRTAT